MAVAVHARANSGLAFATSSQNNKNHKKAVASTEV
jgi:hypothetical protein